MQAFASILLESSSGELILQHRDDNPNIINPGKISLFGGHLEPNEEPEAGAIREIKEELGLDVDTNQLKPLFTVTDHHTDRLMTIFLVNNVDKKKLRLYEGQAIVYLRKSDKIRGSNLSDLAKFCIARYWGITI